MSIKSFLINGVEHHCDYNELENIPEINGVLLKGKLTTEELGIKDGKEGPQGEPGAAGADGYSPTVAITEITGGHRVTVTDKNGAHNFDVMDGTGGGGGTGPSPYSSNPAPLGTASPGSSNDYARGDHVHPKPSASDIGAYVKPSGGIPKTDLASAVQTSLGKADTALQSVPSTYRTAAAQDTIDSAQDAAIAAKYTKPASGIPASDLAAGVIPTVPTNVSAFTNDAGYLTLATLPIYNGGVT